MGHGPRTVSAAILAILLLSGCVSSDGGEAEGPTGQGAGDTEHETSDDSDPIEELITARPGTTDPRPVVIHGLEALEADTVMVTFALPPEPCGVLDRVEIEEGPSSVTIGVYVGYEPEPDGSEPECGDEVRYVGTVVPLRPDPDREVIDVATRP
jgi:hypothetical protein